MGRINIEISEELHDEIRHESRIRAEYINAIVREALTEHVETRDLPGDGDRDLPTMADA